MAVLKMLNNDGNYIWLTDVKRVQTMFHFSQGEFPAEQNETALEYMRRALAFHKENAKTSDQADLLWSILMNVNELDNNTCLRFPQKAMILLYVVFDGKPSENWIVQEGYNYLLENGKTVDRI